MKHGHDNLRGRQLLAVNVHGIHGNAAAVIDYSDRVVDVNGAINLVGETSERLVDGVVDHLVHQVMQTQFTG